MGRSKRTSTRRRVQGTAGRGRRCTESLTMQTLQTLGLCNHSQCKHCKQWVCAITHNANIANNGFVQSLTMQTLQTMGLCKLLFSRWNHVNVPTFERIYLLLLPYNRYLLYNYILYSNKSTHILNPLNELYQFSLVSMQSEQLWEMTNVPTFER